MIDESEEKATLRAYLALLTGASVYDTTGAETFLEVDSVSEYEHIKKTLISLGCNDAENAIVYKGEVVVNLEKLKPTVVQLYREKRG